MIPKQEYTVEFKEQAVKHEKEGKSIGLTAKELGLVEQTLRNWVKLSAAGNLLVRVPSLSHQNKWIYPDYVLKTQD